MFPNHIDPAFHTPPNSIERPFNVPSTFEPNSVGAGLYNAVSNALAVELLNQSVGSISFFSIDSADSFENLSYDSLGSFSLVASPAVEPASPISSQISTPRPPTRLMEPIPISVSLSEGEQRSELRRELLNWVSAAGNPLETLERRDAAVDIVSCFHNKSDTLLIQGGNITELPNCIGLLGHLQTLNLSNCRSLKALPNVMHNFINLEDLDLMNCQNLTALPPTVTALPASACLFLEGSGVSLANPLQSQLNRPGF